MIDIPDIKYWLEPAIAQPPEWALDIGMSKDAQRLVCTMFDTRTIHKCQALEGYKSKTRTTAWVDIEKGIYVSTSASRFQLAHTCNDALIIRGYKEVLEPYGIRYAKVLVTDKSKLGTPPGFHVATHDDINKGQLRWLGEMLWVVPNKWEPYEDPQ